MHVIIQKLLHFALLHYALEKLLHFALVLHFAAILITFCVNITFCGDYFILRRNNIFLYIFVTLKRKLASQHPGRIRWVRMEHF